MNIFGMGLVELVFVLVVALLVLGPNKMVETARTLGKYARELQRATAEMPRLFTLEDEQPKTPPPQRQQLPEEASSEVQEPAAQDSVPRE